MGQHVDVTDPDIHEPKGVASQTAGRVYVSDGAGSGSWQRVNVEYAFGSMTITNNTSALAMTAGDLANNSSYVTFTGTPAPYVGENLEGVSFSVDKLTVPFTGIYEVSAYMNISQFPSTTAKIGMKYKVNGSTFSSRAPKVKSAVTSDETQITGFGLVSLNANDFVQIAVASDANGNLIVRDMNVIIKLVRKTA